MSQSKKCSNTKKTGSCSRKRQKFIEYLKESRDVHDGHEIQEADSEKVLPKYSETVIRSLKKPDDKGEHPSDSGCNDCRLNGIDTSCPYQEPAFGKTDSCIRGSIDKGDFRHILHREKKSLYQRMVDT